jgi:hypothetical protein
MKVTLLVRAPKKPEKRVMVEHDVVSVEARTATCRFSPTMSAAGTARL